MDSPGGGGGGGNFQKRTPCLTSSSRGFASSSASTTSSSWRRGGKTRPGSVCVTEAEDAPVDEETQEDEINETAGDVAEDGAEDDGEDNDFQGLQETLEILATELDEAAAAGHSEEEFAALEQQVADAVEALVALRGARAHGALRKDRGFKGRGSGGRGRSGATKEGKCFACGKLGFGKEMQNALVLPKVNLQDKDMDHRCHSFPSR